MPLLRRREDVELVTGLGDLGLRILRLLDLRRPCGELVADLAPEELVLDERAATPTPAAAPRPPRRARWW
jgi:hypothetical protein